jgi:hypothetical protein
MGVGGQCHAPATLAPGNKRPGAHSTGAWVGSRAGPDRCGNSCRHQDSVLGPSIPWRAAYNEAIRRPISINK